MEPATPVICSPLLAAQAQWQWSKPPEREHIPGGTWKLCFPGCQLELHLNENQIFSKYLNLSSISCSRGWTYGEATACFFVPPVPLCLVDAINVSECPLRFPKLWGLLYSQVYCSLQLRYYFPLGVLSSIV